MSINAELDERFSGRLRPLREFRGLSAQALADRIAANGGALTRVAISKIENGHRGVSLGEALVIAEALNANAEAMAQDEPIELTASQTFA